jgi:hypothetical protein
VHALTASSNVSETPSGTQADARDQERGVSQAAIPMDLEKAEDATAIGSAIKVAAASVDRAAFERECEKWRGVVRKNREEGDSEGLLRCAVCTSNKTFATLQALMAHARDTKKQSQLEHIAYWLALEEVEMDMGCKKEQNRGLPVGSGC